MEKVLLTGGSGLLGKEILKNLPEILAPTRSEFDVTNFDQIDGFLRDADIDTIIHAAAFTSPPLIDKDPINALRINIVGTSYIAEICALRNIRLVYISTDYVFKGDKGNYGEMDEVLPQNLYAWSKLGGECAVKMHEDSLIIRTSFCEPVFPYDKAFVDQYTSRDSVEIIAPLILKITFIKDLKGVIHLGTERKTVKELAVKLGKADVGDLKISEVSFKVPKDTSFNCGKIDQLLM